MELEVRCLKTSKTALQSNLLWIILTGFCLLLAVVRVSLLPHHSKYRESETRIEGKIVSYAIDGDKISLKIEGKEKLIGTYYIKSKEEKEEWEEKLKIGATYLFHGKLTLPNKNTIPNAFNYKQYLWYQGIYYTLNIDSIEEKQAKISLKDRIKNSVQKRIKQLDTTGYLNTFILGDKSGLEEEARTNFSNNGVSHLFAISGMHVSLFATMLLAILKRIGDKPSRIIVILFLWMYAFLIDAPASIVRATIFFTLFQWNKLFWKERFTSIQISLICLSCILIVWPNFLYDIGFLYSFLTSFGLILFQKKLQSSNPIKALLKTSCYALLFSLPLTLYTFYTINPLSILWNLLFVPFVSYIIYPLSLLTFFFPFLYGILQFFLWILEAMNTICASITICQMVFPKIPMWLGLVLYSCIFLSLTKKKAWIGYAFILFIWKIHPYFDPAAYVYFLDVGQGDSAILITPHRKEVYMIDTGGTISYEKEEWQGRKKVFHISSNTISFLKSLGISHIDTMFLTHGDADHMGEASYILEHYPVQNIVLNRGETNVLEEHLIEKYPNKIKKKINDIPGIRIWNDGKYQNENDNSMLITFSAYAFQALFLGDASKTVERDYVKEIKQNVDVVKIAHHGSKTSSDPTFLRTLHPKNAIISVGEKNRYGHPSKETIETLENLQIPYYQTSTSGTIKLKIFQKTYTISACLP